MIRMSCDFEHGCLSTVAYREVMSDLQLSCWDMQNYVISLEVWEVRRLRRATWIMISDSLAFTFRYMPWAGLSCGNPSVRDVLVTKVVLRLITRLVPNHMGVSINGGIQNGCFFGGKSHVHGWPLFQETTIYMYTLYIYIYHIISYHIISYHIISYHIISYHIYI